MGEGETFIRDAATKRGIDPDTAITVAGMEGGVDAPGLIGKFDTGWSFWQYQLHYGGPEYPQYGTVAGMGNGFTKLTGWQPGDPRAWRDSVRYALNRVKLGGWEPWYGAAKAGITGFTGVDRDHAWNAKSETWDYETGANPVTVTYNRDSPAVLQNDPWSCAPSSTRWALEAVGRHPSEQWIESTMKAEGVVSEEQGLLDASGAGLADFLNRHYGEFSYHPSNEPIATFQALAAESGRHPLMIGGRNWGGPGLGHWSGLRAYDAVRDVLLLANPASGAIYGGEEMNRSRMAARGPFSMVRLTHPDLMVQSPPPVPPPVPAPTPPPVDPKDARIAELEAALAAEQEKVYGFINAVAYLGDDLGDRLQGVADELRRVRIESVGPRPE